MCRYAFVNGRYVRLRDAFVHVEDRGYQFADGVYEVIAIENGHLVDEEDHMIRLRRSLSELRIALPIGINAMRLVMREVISRNRILARGALYIQITRGVAQRNHVFPQDTPTSLVVTARILPPLDWKALRHCVNVITAPDLRWTRRDIKSVSLLPNVLTKQLALEQGAFEAWMVEPDGTITEGTASNAWIATHKNELVTRHADHAILNGITRLRILQICQQNGIDLVERPFTVSEAKSSKEAFLTSTTALLKPVGRIDNTVIGTGHIGPLTEKLLSAYVSHMHEQGAYAA